MQIAALVDEERWRTTGADHWIPREQPALRTIKFRGQRGVMVSGGEGDAN